MCKDEGGEKTTVKTPGQIKREQNLVKFTPMTSKQAQEAAVKARNIRKQVRAEMLNKVVSNYDFGEEMVKALKKGDLDKVTLLKEAMRLIGLQHDQSEEAAAQKIDLKSDNKVDGKVEISVTGLNG